MRGAPGESALLADVPTTPIILGARMLGLIVLNLFTDDVVLIPSDVFGAFKAVGRENLLHFFVGNLHVSGDCE